MDATEPQQTTANLSTETETVDTLLDERPPPTKPIHTLIIDAGPLIKNDPSVSTLLAQAQELYTLPSVLSEIKDESTRLRVQTQLVPFLKLRNPRPESVKFVTDFARRTGDLEVLSRPDIHLIALTYELECERNGGDWRLRKEPGQKRVNGKSPGQAAREETAAAESKTSEDSNRPGDAVQPVEPSAADAPAQSGETVVPEETAVPEGTIVPEQTTVPEGAVPFATTEAAQLNEEGGVHAAESSVLAGATQLEEAVGSEAFITEHAAATGAAEQSTDSEPLLKQEAITHQLDTLTLEPEKSITLPLETSTEATDFRPTGDVDDDEDGWITPSNLKRHQDMDQKSSPEQPISKTLQVALLTSDYAMQNVLLRINLNLVSPSLARITRVKSWVLRCHGCFKISRNLAKQFCPNCGQATLTRVSCSTDQNGNFQVHLKKNFQFNKRGNVYSVPKPVHGTANTKNRGQGGGKNAWGTELILAEDQKEYTRKADEEKRLRHRDLMDEDYLPSILSGNRQGGTGRIRIGAGRNVNSRKRNG